MYPNNATSVRVPNSAETRGVSTLCPSASFKCSAACSTTTSSTPSSTTPTTRSTTPTTSTYCPVPSTSVGISKQSAFYFIFANIAHLLKKTTQNRSKIEFLSEISNSQTQKCLIIALVETHLTDEIKDSELVLTDFNIARCDRLNRIGGGVCLYINCQVSFTKHISYSNSVCELLIVELSKPSVFVIVMYRPPDCQLCEFQDALSVISQWIRTLAPPLPNIIFMGDFNMPHFDWVNMPLSTNYMQTSSLLDVAHQLFLTQHVSEPTRKNNILDLVFASSGIINNVVIQKTAISDHNLIVVDTNFPTSLDLVNPLRNPIRNKFELLDFNKANWDELRAKLVLHDWASILTNTDSCKCLDTIQNVLLSVCEKCVPTKSLSKKRKNSFQKSRRKHLRKRTRTCAKLQAGRNMSKFRKIKLNDTIISIETILLESHESERKYFEQIAVDKIKTDPKYFFKYASRSSKLIKCIGPMLTESNGITNNPQHMCELLQDQYLKVFSLPSSAHIIQDINSFFMTENTTTPLLDTINISPDDVLTAIKDISGSSAAGPDGMPSTLFKNCSKELAQPLAVFYQKTIEEGILPSICKAAAVIPIHKGGDKSLPSNYRPISLTPIITKILERIIRHTLVSYLENNDLMNCTQHGFRKGRSCISALIEVYDNMMQSLADPEVDCVDMIYLDFAKAFDKVDHHILLRKLKSLGITGKLGIWLSSFLLDRSQFVQIPGGVSGTGTVTSGVPQGTVLGPVLFLILISDINSNIETCKISSFADDTRLYSAISDPQNCDKLQEDLSSVYKWAESNNMCFNSEKFKYLCFSTKHSTNTDNVYLSPTNSIINPSTSVRDLGILMSSNCSFEAHLDKSVKTCSQLVGWILRTFSTRDKLTMLTLFKSLVLPRIEYGSQLWSPYKICQINSVERIQRSFTKHISNMYDLSYEERLQTLNLYSLQRRRDRYMIIYIWKILEQHVSNLNPPIKINSSERLGRMCIRTSVNPGHQGTLMFNSFRWKAIRLLSSHSPEVHCEMSLPRVNVSLYI